MQVVGYVRVSTDEQADQGVSLAAQAEMIRDYCKLYKLDLLQVVEDAGQSGKSLDRPGLQECLSLLRKKQVGGLVIAKLDRLTRSVVDGGQLIRDYFGEGRRCELFSVADQINTRTAAGQLVLNLLLSVSQWERQAIGERTKVALRHKIAKGERVGKIRYGYDLAEDGVSLVRNEVEQAGIELMRSLRSRGDSYRAIAAELNDRGISTKEGGRWLFVSVRKILARASST
jgi:DNA invertase Pin-like site-specific DNA recombinase